MRDRITAFVIDDEPLSRNGLALKLSKVSDIEVIGQYQDGIEASKDIIRLQPQVLFLDIEMPGLNGLELTEKLKQQNYQPYIVYVTAFQQYALKAFDYQAVDYLLKPFSEQRLYQSLEKIRAAVHKDLAEQQQHKLEQLLGQKTGKSLTSLIDNLEHSRQDQLSLEQALQQTISVKSGSEWFKIEVGSILWIEAAGDYMCIRTNDGSHIIRKTLKQFEQELSQYRFARVSRSVLVNSGKINRLTPNANGEYLATLTTGDQIKVSRKFKSRLDELRR